MTARENNQRKTQRAIHSQRLICLEEQTGECHPVRLLNFSKTGVYFESLRKIPPGTRVLIHSRGGARPGHDTDPICSGYKSMSRIQVKWCKTLGGRNYPYFGIGGKYL